MGGLSPPESVVTTWQPNYINLETRGSDVIIVESVLLALCYVVVGLRMWARFHQSRNFGTMML
jgi:hypothetical protein